MGLNLRRHSLLHVRGHSRFRRVVVDTHDLRFGVFWVKREGGYHGVWAHVPCLIFDLSRRDP